MNRNFRTHAPWARCLVLSVLVALLSCGFAAAQEKTVWVTMGSDLFERVAKTPGALSGALPLKAFDASDGVVITRLPERDLPALSAFSHEELRRCGGFIVHDSLEEAALAMKAAGVNRYKTLPSEFQIDEQATVNALLPLLDKTNILNTIDHLSTSYTNRYYQYTSGQQSALWIRDQWLGFANGRPDITVETYNHGFSQPSVIMTIAGTTLASEIVVLGGHLDSIKSGGMTTGTVAPGADDDGSGIATISEVIRVLMADGFTPDRTIKFIGYAAEEVGLRGSADIASDHQSAGADVVAVLEVVLGFHFVILVGIVSLEFVVVGLAFHLVIGLVFAFHFVVRFIFRLIFGAIVFPVAFIDITVVRTLHLVHGFVEVAGIVEDEQGYVEAVHAIVRLSGCRQEPNKSQCQYRKE